VFAVLLWVRLIARHARFARWLHPALPSHQSPRAAFWADVVARDQAQWLPRHRSQERRPNSPLRPGNDLTYRRPLIVEALTKLRSRSCIIDSEAVACDARELRWRREKRREWQTRSNARIDSIGRRAFV